MGWRYAIPTCEYMWGGPSQRRMMWSSWLKFIYFNLIQRKSLVKVLNLIESFRQRGISYLFYFSGIGLVYVNMVLYYWSIGTYYT